MSSDYSRSWPYIPRNLTLFSLDDYSPAWRYPSCPSPCPSPCDCPCRVGGFPRPPGCANESSGLWVYPQYNAAIFAPGRLGANTKLLMVPPTYGSHNNCAPPSVWCTNQTYAQWLELNKNNFVSSQSPRALAPVLTPCHADLLSRLGLLGRTHRGLRPLPSLRLRHGHVPCDDVNGCWADADARDTSRVRGARQADREPGPCNPV